MGPPKLKMCQKNEKSGQETLVPSISIGDDWSLWVDAGHHLAGLHEIVHRRNGQVGLTKTRSSRSGTTVMSVRTGSFAFTKKY